MLEGFKHNHYNEMMKETERKMWITRPRAMKRKFGSLERRGINESYDIQKADNGPNEKIMKRKTQEFDLKTSFVQLEGLRIAVDTTCGLISSEQKIWSLKF